MATTTERVTVTLPSALVEEIAHFERNRSRFISEAVERELWRRRRAELERSLAQPHGEVMEVEAGFDGWADETTAEDAGLVDAGAGTAVSWVEGEGWRAEDEG